MVVAAEHNNNSSSSSTKQLLLLSGPDSKLLRTGMVIWWSADGGESWRKALDVDPGTSGYSSLQFMPAAETAGLHPTGGHEFFIGSCTVVRVAPLRPFTRESGMADMEFARFLRRLMTLVRLERGVEVAST